METKFYNSKIDWYVFLIIPFIIFCFMIGPILTKSDYWLGLILSLIFCPIYSFLIFTTKYAIRGNEFGVKLLLRWHWFPIDKIKSITPTKSILSAPALSIHRIAIKFTDKKILKSSIPLEISPNDKAVFISEILKINPDIKISNNEVV